MLEAQHRCRREYRDLLAILHRLEGRAHGDLRLAVTYVAAQQPIHRLRAFHIALDVGDRVQLVVGLVEVERVLELALQIIVRRKRRPHRRRALCVQLQQLFGHILHGLLHPGLGLRPRLVAELVQLRRRPRIRRTILLNQVQARQRNVKFRIVREVKNHQLQRGLIRLLQHAQPLVLRNPVLHVNDIVADSEIAEVRNKRRRLRLPRHRPSVDIGIVRKIVRAKHKQLPPRRAVEVEHLHTVRNRCTRNDGRAQVTAQITRFRVNR